MSNDMRKLMKIMESNDAIDRFPDDYAGDMEDLATTNLDGECPTCHDWGEILPPDVEQDMDNIIPCPDCGPEHGPAAQGKSKIIKQMADEIDSDWTVKDFPLSEGDPDDTDWDAHWAREDGDDERADDLEADAEWARMDSELNEDTYTGAEAARILIQAFGWLIASGIIGTWIGNYLGNLATGDSGGYVPRGVNLALKKIRQRLNLTPKDFQAAKLIQRVYEQDPEFKALIDKYMKPDGSFKSAGYGKIIDYVRSKGASEDVYHFMEKLRGFRQNNPLDESEMYNKCSDDEMNDAILSNTCGVCGEKFKWEGNPDDEMCPRCTGEYIGEEKAPECDKCYGLGRKPSGGADCEACGGTGNCPKVEEDLDPDGMGHYEVVVRRGVGTDDFYEDVVSGPLPFPEANKEALEHVKMIKNESESGAKVKKSHMLDQVGWSIRPNSYSLDDKYVGGFVFIRQADDADVEAWHGIGIDEDEGDDLGIGMQPADLKRVGQTYVIWRSDYPVEYKHKIDPAYAHNERMTNHDSRKEALAQIKAEIQAYIATHDEPSVTHERGSTVWQGKTPYDPAYERGAFDQKWRLKEVPVEKWVESINLDSIVESVLQEFEGQPKDYEMSDDELETEVEDKNEVDTIDPEIEDEELGLRFD